MAFKSKIDANLFTNLANSHSDRLLRVHHRNEALAKNNQHTMNKIEGRMLLTTKKLREKQLSLYYDEQLPRERQIVLNQKGSPLTNYKKNTRLCRYFAGPDTTTPDSYEQSGMSQYGDETKTNGPSHDDLLSYKFKQEWKQRESVARQKYEQTRMPYSIENYNLVFGNRSRHTWRQSRQEWRDLTAEGDAFLQKLRQTSQPSTRPPSSNVASPQSRNSVYLPHVTFTP